MLAAGSRLRAQQEAKLPELRAATSLARRDQSQGRHVAAREALTDVLEWFSAGLTTSDLQAARTLISELSGV